MGRGATIFSPQYLSQVGTSGAISAVAEFLLVVTALVLVQ